jgi:hypothetical protein
METNILALSFLLIIVVEKALGSMQVAAAKGVRLDSSEAQRDDLWYRPTYRYDTGTLVMVEGYLYGCLTLFESHSGEGQCER